MLAALCDILDCQPNDLIEPYVAARSAKARKVAGQQTPTAADRSLRPTRARIVSDDTEWSS